MKLTSKLLFFLGLCLLIVSCEKNDEIPLEMGAIEQKMMTGEELTALSESGKSGPAFGTIQWVAAGTPIPANWLFQQYATIPGTSIPIIYVGGASFGAIVSIVPGQSLPNGWLYRQNANNPNIPVDIIYVGGASFGTIVSIAPGQSLPSGWVFQEYTSNPSQPIDIVFVNGGFDGDIVNPVAPGQILPSGWVYISQMSIKNISGNQRPATLKAGEQLLANQSVTSPSGNHTLVMQGDGNLVIYKSNGKAIWATATYGTLAARLVMQTDGNLVLYSSDFTMVFWHSQTYGNNGAELYLQDDGNLVIYKNGTPLWDSFSNPIQPI